MIAVPIINPSDKRNGIIAAVITMVLLFIYLYFTKVIMADPPPKEIPMKTETVIDQLELENLKVETGGSGSGTPNTDPIEEPRPQSQQIITKQNNPRTQTVTGQSSHTTTPNPQNTSSTTHQSNDPFASGGSGGGNQGGSGGRFGSDVGSGGTGPGGPGGNGAGRTRLNDPNVEHIETNVNITVNLKLTINEDGNVVGATNISSKTTTTDQRIINQVISAVKSQVKYNKNPGSGLTNVYLTVKLNAT